MKNKYQKIKQLMSDDAYSRPQSLIGVINDEDSASISAHQRFGTSHNTLNQATRLNFK
jgi:hypothetical protein